MSLGAMKSEPLMPNTLYHDAPDSCVQGFDFLCGHVNGNERTLFYMEDKLCLLEPATINKKLNKFLKEGYAISLVNRIFGFESSKLYVFDEGGEVEWTGADKLRGATRIFARGSIKGVIGKVEVPIIVHFLSPAGATAECCARFPAIHFITKRTDLRFFVGDLEPDFFDNPQIRTCYVTETTAEDDHDPTRISAEVNASFRDTPLHLRCLPTLEKFHLARTVAYLLGKTPDDLTLQVHGGATLLDSPSITIRHERSLVAISATVEAAAAKAEDAAKSTVNTHKARCSRDVAILQKDSKKRKR
jgi:hypothetical protein